MDYLQQEAINSYFALKGAKSNQNEIEHFKAIASWCNRFMALKNLDLRKKIKVSHMLLRIWKAN